jgi:hypothetical protein
VDREEKVGFYWGSDTDTAWPDAWCAQCERALVALHGGSSEQWFKDAEFFLLHAGTRQKRFAEDSTINKMRPNSYMLILKR